MKTADMTSAVYAIMCSYCLVYFGTKVDFLAHFLEHHGNYFLLLFL
jgi:hypothetical protein